MSNAEIIASVARWQALQPGNPLTCRTENQHRALHAIEVDGMVILSCLDCGSQHADIPDVVRRGAF